jgi:Xaa-Pro aminopeptidase
LLYYPLSIMKPLFNAEFFRQNREKLRTLFMGTAPIVLTANGSLQRNGDNEYLFRQDSSFWYLTGIDDPDVILVLDKNKEYLILPDRDYDVLFFNGQMGAERFTAVSGIAEVLDEKKGWKRLGSRLKKAQHAATLAPAPPYIERMGFYTNPARARLVSRIKEINDQIELLDLRPHLSRMREVKQGIELEAIQTAIDITTATLKDVERKLSKYAYEYEIEADVSHGFRKRGATGHTFFPVVASGLNSCTLHYSANNASLQDARVLYMDVGAEYQHYSADITRTYLLATEPTKRELAVYQAVLEVMDYAKTLIKPGAQMHENEKLVEHFMGEKLRELGLIKSIESEEVRKFYPHAVSHSLGLDPHDAMDYDRPLEPGMVLTVEPGIYIPAEALGVRIEDDLLVTEDGYKLLNSNLPPMLK